jgi:hypothetical protein
VLRMISLGVSNYKELRSIFEFGMYEKSTCTTLNHLKLYHNVVCYIQYLLLAVLSCYMAGIHGWYELDVRMHLRISYGRYC